MTGAQAVRLPVGLWWGGARHRDAVLRPMTGAVEESLAEGGPARSPAARATDLLARCLERVGPLEPVPPDAVRRLTAGDREFLLLHLRRLTFGDKLEPTVRCPRAGCGEKMDVPLAVSQLAGEPAAPAAGVPEFVARDGLRFRLPCGADLEAVAALAGRDPAGAGRELLRRCLADGPAPSAAEVERVGAWMAELDPHAELRLSLTCPACGHPFSSLLDAGAYLYDEVRLRARNLYHEVHLLAFHYHWSERDILALTPAKRRRYIDLLFDALRASETG